MSEPRQTLGMVLWSQLVASRLISSLMIANSLRDCGQFERARKISQLKLPDCRRRSRGRNETPCASLDHLIGGGQQRFRDCEVFRTAMALARGDDPAPTKTDARCKEWRSGGELRLV